MMMTSAEKISLLMEKQNLTQNGLARAAGVSQSGLSSILSGASSPKEITLHLIAQALHVKTADLLSDFEDHLSFEMTDPDEAKLIDIYRALTQEGKSMLLNQADLLISSPSLREKSISAAAR